MICFIDEQHLKATYRFIFLFFAFLFLFIGASLFYINPFDSSNHFLGFLVIFLSTIFFLLYIISKKIYFRVKLDEYGLHYDYKIFNKREFTICYNEIASYCYTGIPYRLIRFNKKNNKQIFIVDGEDLLTITLKNNQKISLSTKNIDFLIDTLEHYL